MDEIHEIISPKQSKWFKKSTIFNTQKRNKAKNKSEKDFYELLNNAFYGKTRENIRNRMKLEFNKKYEYKKIIKRQS